MSSLHRDLSLVVNKYDADDLKLDAEGFQNFAADILDIHDLTKEEASTIIKLWNQDQEGEVLSHANLQRFRDQFRATAASLFRDRDLALDELGGTALFPSQLFGMCCCFCTLFTSWYCYCSKSSKIEDILDKALLNRRQALFDEPKDKDQVSSSNNNANDYDMSNHDNDASDSKTNKLVALLEIEADHNGGQAPIELDNVTKNAEDNNTTNNNDDDDDNNNGDDDDDDDNNNGDDDDDDNNNDNDSAAVTIHSGDQKNEKENTDTDSDEKDNAADDKNTNSTAPDGENNNEKAADDNQADKDGNNDNEDKNNGAGENAANGQAEGVNSKKEDNDDNDSKKNEEQEPQENSYDDNNNDGDNEAPIAE